MLIFAASVFFISLLCIGILFALNIREQRIGRYAAAEWRAAADREALHLRELLAAADLDLKKMPPLASHLLHVLLHFAALEFARLAREASKQAHRLADFVSHKRNFERRQTRSEFLKKMSERKNRESNDQHGQETEENVN